jgi:hypothetical protein
VGWIPVSGRKQKCRGVLGFSSENGATVIDNVGIGGAVQRNKISNRLESGFNVHLIGIRQWKILVNQGMHRKGGGAVGTYVLW